MSEERTSGPARLLAEVGVLVGFLSVVGCTGSIASGPGGAGGSGAQGTQPALPMVPGCAATPSPGHVTVHRLNRVEYNNTIRDLLGDTSRPADELPADDAAAGFDNNSAVLNSDSDLLKQYEGIALRLAQKHLPSLMTCKPVSRADEAACAKAVLEPLARRAWRRPPDAEELADVMELVKTAESDPANDFNQAMELAVEAVLLSPSFLFRIEYPPGATSSGAYLLDAHSLASRLSYFLWSSMPDNALFAAADSGKLLDPKELTAQAVRMLKDPKAKDLAENIAGQWLFGRKVDTAMPLASRFPQYDNDLRLGAQREVALFLDAFMEQNLDLRGLLDANFTFVNERLARHYGIAGIKGPDFRRVALDGNPQRGGALTQAAFLLATSKADEPSIPRRGLTVLTNFMCFVPGHPPANANDVQMKIENQLGPNPTRRQTSVARQNTPGCGGCHNQFDAIGLALDNYDAIGAWRTYDESDSMKRPISAVGMLEGVGSFTGPRELSALLKNDGRIPGCVTANFFRYSLGRSTSTDDQCMLDQITTSAAEKGFLAQDLISALVSSNAFRFQAE